MSSKLSLCRKRRPQESELDETDSGGSGSSARRRRVDESTTTPTLVPKSQVTLVQQPPSSSQLRLSQSQLNAMVSANVRCGKVVRMHLVNFMCHSNLCIDYSSRVNFLVGRNGSGKSAVMAALVLGLGAKAKATNRSASMKQFIKTGETSAKIEITLSNEGPEAYESDVYGDRIVIVRSITQSAATYTIKNQRGNVISRKVDDLHRILMYHNVQVDNPVFVLNQDSAREFLKDLEPSKNYKLFLKATQIEMVMEKLNDCLHSYKDHQRRMQCYKMVIAKNQKEIEELRGRYRQLMSLEQLKDTLSKKQLERLWLLVSNQENELNEVETQLASKHKRKDSLLRVVENRDQVEQDYKREIAEFEQVIAEKNASITQDNSLYLQLKAEVNKMADRYNQIDSYVMGFKKRRTFIEEQIKELKNNIEERSQNNMGDIAEIRRHNETVLADLQKVMQENDAIIGTAKRDMKMCLDSKMEHDECITALKQKRIAVDEEIRRLGTQIANIKASSKDKLAIYGDDVSRLLIEIEKSHRAGKFLEMPRGPIGRYIEVPNANYRNVVENQVGGLLKAFIVSNTKDRLVLDGILKSKFPRFHPVIITQRFMTQVYDVRHGCVSPPRGTRLLLQEVQCSDAVVMNCLIDRMSMETVLLAESKQIAEQITSNRENVPHHLSKVIVPEPGLEYYPEPNYRMYSMKIQPARFIQVNVKDRIVQLEFEQSECQQRISKFSSELKAHGPKLREHAQAIEERRALLEQHEAKKRELQEKIRELQNYEYPEYNEVDILKKELEENERKLAEVKQKINDKKIELTEARSDRERLESEMKSQKKGMASIEEEINEIKNNCEEVRTKMRSLNHQIRDNQEKLKRLNEELKQLTNDKTMREQSLGEATTIAEERGERIATQSTEEVLVETIQQLKAKLKHTSKINEDPLQLKKLIESKEHTVKVDISNYENFKLSIEMLNKSRHKRCDVIRRLKQHMVLLLQFSFDHVLKLRQFVGSIEVDHQEKTLSVSVVPRDNHLENAVSSTKALSGGERSFSTIAFLISLWACVDHPFYFLDEYDVFTDEVNREYITRLLINEGKKKPNRQYSFLTPQDMSIRSEDFIKIHRFAEPDRRT